MIGLSNLLYFVELMCPIVVDIVPLFIDYVYDQ